MTFSGNSSRGNHECELNVTKSNHECEINVSTQFTDQGGDCGDGILDRITSDGIGRVTSDGQCRIIA